MDTKEKAIRKLSQRSYVLLGIIVIQIVFFSIFSKGFFSLNTFMNIIRQSAALALSAIGMTYIILSGGIDLSVGSTIAFSGTLSALVMRSLGDNGLNVFILGLLVTLFATALIGFINGTMIGYLKISPFIVTLGSMSLARGLSLTISDASRILVNNNIYNSFASKDIYGTIPSILLFLIVAYYIGWILLKKSTFGRRTYAIGNNLETSKASGIRTSFQTLLVYLVASIFYGFATMVIVGRARSAQPMAGIGMEFDVITAVVLGGTSLLGGRGNLKSTALGVMLIAVISTGLGMLDISPFINYIVKGFLILFAIISNRPIRKWKSESTGMEKRTQIAYQNAMALEHISKNEQRVLSIKNVSKSFPGVKALDCVDLEIRRGKVHALVGENGAGKSTLMKTLSGVYTKDSGEFLIDGIPITIKSPMDSQKFGISVIYQELPIVPELNVFQNVFLGKEIVSKNKIFLNSFKMIERTKELLSDLSLNINVSSKIRNFSIGQQQIVEIAKSLDSHFWVVVMDEPTSAISEEDKENLFKIIEKLKKRGVAIIYISHRLSEIFEIADEITVLRDGKHVITSPVSELDENTLVKYMVGRELKDVFRRERRQPGDVVFKVDNLFREGFFKPISFEVRAGEVIGFGGLVGAGRTEIMRCVFGLDRADGGDIYLNNKKVEIKNPTDAIGVGISLISEDRRNEGILPYMSVKDNLTITSLPWINWVGLIDRKKEDSIYLRYSTSLDVKTTSSEQAIMHLSGGNQQKVCIGKWLARNPRVIIMDEPTRGIDVGAKTEIYQIIEELLKMNVALILISSEMVELLGMADRIFVLHEGIVTAEYNVNSNLTQEMIMEKAAGLL